MDGSYWTLYVEVKYYVIAGAVYYFNRQTFVRNMVLVSSLMVFGLLLVEAAMPGALRVVSIIVDSRIHSVVRARYWPLSPLHRGDAKPLVGHDSAGLAAVILPWLLS